MKDLSWTRNLYCHVSLKHNVLDSVFFFFIGNMPITTEQGAQKLLPSKSEYKYICSIRKVDELWWSFANTFTLSALILCPVSCHLWHCRSRLGIELGQSTSRLIFECGVWLSSPYSLKLMTGTFVECLLHTSCLYEHLAHLILTVPL